MQKRLICLLPSCVPRQQSSFGAEALLDWQRRGGTENPRGLNPQKIAKKKGISRPLQKIKIRLTCARKVKVKLKEDEKIPGYQKRKRRGKKPKKNLSFSLIERVILSAGAMLIFSVFYDLTVCLATEGNV